jgi:hypothetical protein
MEGEKSLRVPRRFESPHLPFPLAGWLMRGFDSIVGKSIHTVSHVAEDVSDGSGVASQFVGNDPQRFGALTTQESSKESLCSALITLRLDQDVDDVAVLIHGSPQILLSAVDSNEDLIQVPVVAQSSLSSLQFASIVRTELLTPLPDRLIGHDDSALGEEILDISEAQAEAMVSPNCIADDLGRETKAGVTRAIAFHGTSVSGFVANLTMPAWAFGALLGLAESLRLPTQVHCQLLEPKMRHYPKTRRN